MSDQQDQAQQPDPQAGGFVDESANTAPEQQAPAAGDNKKGTAKKGTATKGTAKKGTATKGQAAESVDDDAGTRADPTRRTGPADREDLPPMDASPQPDVGGEPVRASGAGALDAPPPPGRS